MKSITPTAYDVLINVLHLIFPEKDFDVTTEKITETLTEVNIKFDSDNGLGDIHVVMENREE